MGGSVAQENAHDSDHAVDRRRLPAVWPAAGNQSGIKAGLGDSSNNRLVDHGRMSAVSSMPASLMDQIQTVKGVRNIVDLEFFRRLFSRCEKLASGVRDPRRQTGARLSRAQYHRGADRCHEGDAPRGADRTAVGEEIRLESRRQNTGRYDDLDQQRRQQQLGFRHRRHFRPHSTVRKIAARQCVLDQL